MAVGDALIPVMTSNTTPSGVASASSSINTNFAAYKAFDGQQANLSTMQGGWLAAASDNAPFLAYEFDSMAAVGSIWIETANNGATYTPRIYIEGFNGDAWENCLQTGEYVDIMFMQSQYSEYTVQLNNNEYSAIRLRAVESLYKGVNQTACTFSRVQVYEGASTPSYTVEFYPNGGSGTMPNQTIEAGAPTPLTLCAFTREGYTFGGWATSSGGAAVYSDGETVTDIAEADETIILYAVWLPERLTIILQTNNSEDNRAYKDLTLILSTPAILKEETNIINPVFLLNKSIAEIKDANYLTVPAFNRSYFINDMVSVRNDLTRISAHVDVLSSFIEQLKECDAIIHRQENQWNLYLDDGVFKTYQNPNIVVKKFPSGFTTQSFVLAVAGD